MPTPLLMDHDGAIDDLLSQLLVLTMPDVELIGVTVTPADCFIEPALESAYKLLQIMGKESVPLGRGDYYGINAFPNEWRARPEIINALPMLINLPKSPDPYGYLSAPDLIIDKLAVASGPVSILMTGPCSNLVLALEKAPDLKAKIGSIVWMAGAFRTSGNVQTFQHDGSAEWNVFWDPISSQKLVSYELPLTLIPLDVTNHVPVTKQFLSRLATQIDYKLSNLTGQLWALTLDTIPSYHYTYFMWDILATSYLAIPDYFTTETVKANVSTRPPNAGQTYLDDTGYELTIATDVKTADFYDYILGQFKQ
ncbi:MULTISPECIES: nucleoside hydrolase [unclassified Spirosoma]|uniref:nucleoside hydrolase n=1 Tax=unclassified Spirosoma TaxID=2621999 RepID=UPI00095D9115|nr:MULTISPECIES: nucleoside hydrolase [unclassified Spirosoma]MBN8820594.1 nucleoside hydrolase [Spirosoma sp.]OJW76079.1 MAG: nucleoside hydrolase [Spirosoma sp. 48-14]